MHEGEDIFGRRLSREIVREQITDETGDEFVCEHIIETVDRFDGAVESVQSTEGKLLACGHVHQPGHRMVRCDACSKRAGCTVFVCASCVERCACTGLHICPKCAKIGPDGRRYSPKGYKQARRMGLFDTPQAASPSCAARPVCAPARRSSLLGKLLEWW